MKQTKFIMQTGLFDYIIAFVIILNTLFLGIQANYQATHLTEETPSWLRGIEISFAAVFAAEFAMRLLIHRSKFFLHQDRWWNCFDAIVILLQLLEEGMLLLRMLKVTSDSGIDSSGALSLRVLRVFRLVRIIRIIRVLHLVQELRSLIVSIFSSSRALMWTLLLLFLLIYSLSVCFTQRVADFFLHNSPQDSPELERYFGNLFKTMLSLYLAISGGLGWEVLSDCLEKLSIPWVLLLGFYIGFTILALFNLCTGVFVESASATVKQDKDLTLLKSVQSLFGNHDGSSSKISWEEFESKMQSTDMQMFFKSIELDSEEAHGIFSLIDVDGCGAISSDDLLHGLLLLRGSAKAVNLAILMREQFSFSQRWREHAQSVELSLNKLVGLMEKSGVVVEQSSQGR